MCINTSATDTHRRYVTRCHSWVSVALLEHLQQVEERLCDIEQRMQERLRILELRMMQMERQSWKRSFGTASQTLPITPSSGSSLSSRSSSTGPLCTPKTHRGFDDGPFRSSSPDAFNPYWISPIVEEDSSLPGAFSLNLRTRTTCFPTSANLFAP